MAVFRAGQQLINKLSSFVGRVIVEKFAHIVGGGDGAGQIQVNPPKKLRIRSGRGHRPASLGSDHGVNLFVQGRSRVCRDRTPADGQYRDETNPIPMHFHGGLASRFPWRDGMIGPADPSQYPVTSDYPEGSEPLRGLQPPSQIISRHTIVLCSTKDVATGYNLPFERERLPLAYNRGASEWIERH